MNTLNHSTDYTVLSFYKFVELFNLKDLQKGLREFCLQNQILGTILLAKEGINAGLAARPNAIDSFVEFLGQSPNFTGIPFKYSCSNFIPFQKMKVMIKKEIVTFGMPLNADQKTGIPVDAKDWNELITKPEVLVIDTRNSFEVELGSFKGAVNPGTRKFSDFKDFVKQQLDRNQHKKIAMFCTGGIRCEKASTYLLELGFENVYQLQGGILQYLEYQATEAQENKPKNSLWQGECFVFDERITI